MPPVYEFSNPFFFSDEKLRLEKGAFTDVHKDGEGGLYLAVSNLNS